VRQLDNQKSISVMMAGVVFTASSCLGQSLVWQSSSPSPSEATALLRVVCPGSIQPVDGTPTSLPGCKPCPEYTTAGRFQPRIAMHEAFALRTVIYGSFTAPGGEEALAGFQGCESRATGFSGSILLRKLHGSWAMGDYAPARITVNCQTYHLKTGRDLLLCEEQVGHMDEASQWIPVCDFSKEKPSRCQSVFALLDTRNACGHSAVWGSIDKVELGDLNGDGIPDLTLWIRVGHCAFPNAGGSCNADTTGAPVQRDKLDF
jgi:hypothetical protein